MLREEFAAISNGVRVRPAGARSISFGEAARLLKVLLTVFAKQLLTTF